MQVRGRGNRSPVGENSHEVLPRGRFASVARNVFFPSVIILVLLVGVAIAAPQQMNAFIQPISDAIVTSFTWYYVLVVAAMVVFVFVVALSRKGDIVLGKDEDEPEHSLGSWFAMLFAAGMGIGLVFYGAAEPLMQFANPHPGVPLEATQRAQSAMTTSIFHFGLSAWAIYAVVGLAVAYAIHRKGHSVSLRWTLSSVLGEHAMGKAGDAIDIVATVATLIGVATSLGFGVMQLSSGVEYLTGIELSKSQVVIVAVAIFALAAISVSSGLDRGIKFLSDANLVMAAVFALMVALLGPTLFVLNGIVQDVGDYLARMPSLMMQMLPFGGREGSDWMGTWTVYYWAWWISWSPFVGIFIARISRGRTVREFVMGVVLVPTLVTLIWFGVMGGTSLYQQIFGGVQFIGADGAVDASRALFQMLDNLPASRILSGAALIILIVFFVTSSDSGSYVMSMLTTGGNTTPPMSVRLLWAILTGAVTASLLAAGGGEGCKVPRPCRRSSSWWRFP